MPEVLGDYRKGEDIRLALDVMSGDAGVVLAVTAAMRKARFYGTGVTFERGDPIAVEVIAREPTGEVPGGWTLIVKAEVTVGLEVGTYGIDARLEIGGGVEITDQSAVISLSEGALA